MENTVYSDELQHHGTKGMRWGVRRYQNKDGSLTPAGQKRYNKEVEKLKKETEKVKAAEKVAANRKKAQSKFDKLEEKKQQLEERKKALKGKKDDTPDDIATAAKKKGKTPEEELAERREKLLKSSDPKELYEGKDLLTYQELNDRINRIDLENRLQSKIPREETKEQKTAAEWMDSATKTINSASALYKSVDSAYSSFANSSIAKALGLELPTGQKKEKAFNAEEFLAKMRENKLTAKEIQEGTNTLKNINTSEQQKKQIDKGRNEHKEAEQAQLKKEAEAKAKKDKADADAKAKSDAEEQAKRDRDEKIAAAQKQVDDYNERWQKGEVGRDTRYGKSGSQLTDAKYDVNVDTGRKALKQLLLPGPTDSDNASTPRIGTQKIAGLLESNEYASNRRKKGETIIDVEPDEIIYLKDRQNTGKQAVDKVVSTAKQDVKYTKREKDGDEWKYTYEGDGGKAAEKALKTLQAAAKSSSKAVEKVETLGDDVIKQLIEENERKLNGR